MRLSRMGLLFTLCALLPSIIFGATPAEPAEESIVHVKMYGENTSIQPGKPFWLAVQLNIVEHWHVYWKHPGQAGMPTELWWNLPEGFKAGEIQWPTPKHFESNGMVAFGYEGNPVLLVEITPPAQLEIGENVNLSADVTWVACHDSCIPGDQSVSISLPVSRFEPLKDVSSTHIFEDARAALPKPLKVAVSTEGDNIELTFDSPENFGVRRLVRGYLFSDNDAMLELNLGPASGEHGDTPGVARLQIPILNNGGQLPAVISGVLRLEDATGAWVAGFNIDAPLNPIASTGTDPIAVPASPVAGSPNTGGAEAPMTIVTFLLALGGAFLGGLLLNLMPCVMPVISLKILGFVKMAGKEDRGAFWYCLAFTGGVLSSFLALASMLLILQASGSAVGWGFQLQEPGFVAVMCFVLVLVGLNFFGVFEMGTSVASAAGSLQTSG
ncbi:MAG: hypothetical protein KDK78_08655, partial [Chlamydiia bacterium]|nr:hypothetical protein [Chlamydiia bacterium]